MYKRIVVPLDGSDLAARALPQAEELARLTGAPLHLVRIADFTRLERYGVDGLAIEYAGMQQVLAVEEETAREYLARIDQELTARGLPATTELRRGVVARELVALALPGDLLVMASHGRGRLGRWFLGSVAEDVVRRPATRRVRPVQSFRTLPADAPAPPTLRRVRDGFVDKVDCPKRLVDEPGRSPHHYGAVACRLPRTPDAAPASLALSWSPARLPAKRDRARRRLPRTPFSASASTPSRSSCADRAPRGLGRIAVAANGAACSRGLPWMDRPCSAGESKRLAWCWLCSCWRTCFSPCSTREGTGIIGDRVARLTWRVFRWASRPFGRHRATVLSFCGPAILVLLVAVWAVVLVMGAALIIHPRLGTSVTATSGPTPTDFVSALYAGGSSIAIVGADDFGPQTGAFRLFYLCSSLVGVAGLSLTLTYLMQVYAALQQRNTLGLQVDLAAGQTGDAAELLAGLGAGGEFDRGYSDLASLAAGMAEVKEAHHFYPVLFYFRFRDPRYAASRFALVSLDAVALVGSALDDERSGWLKESAAVAQLRRASMILVTMQADTFLPGDVPDPRTPPDEQTHDRWRRRYHAGRRRLQQAGIQTTADEQAGAEVYVALRAGWDRYVMTPAPSMVYRPDEIDPAGSDPGAGERQESRTPLRSVG